MSSARPQAVQWPPQIRRLGAEPRLEQATVGGARWCFDEVAGRLVELCDERSCAALTFAVQLVHDAQRCSENVAWITSRESSFYPPDVAEWGVDLDALAVVRLLDAREIAGAADALARSGAFGLLVLDLGAHGDVPNAVQTRLLGLAQKHGAAIVCLTIKSRERPSLGSLFSLRAQASRRACGAGRFECELAIVKDKRRAPGRRHSEVCRGPHGLC
jgi:recombination protein RecA